MKKKPVYPSLLLTIFLTIATVAVSCIILMLLRDYLSPAVSALLFLVPVVICATLWGRLSGITASILSFLIFNFLFLSPYFTLRVAHPQDFIMMVVFLGVAILVSSIMSRAQSRLVQIQTQEREALQLYHLSADLSGISDELTIMQTLAERISEFFKPTCVEINVAGLSSVKVPENSSPPAENLSMSLPLQSTREKLGEIKIWGIAEKLTDEEERLLQTFASQGTLALDRAKLTSVENRAKVLEESDRLKTAILSSVSHELRTPLASILASATSLFNPDVSLEPAAEKELQALLLEETEHMILLVGNLLNMSRLEVGALKLQRQWNAIGEIINLSLKRLRRIAGTHKIDILVSDDLPLIAVDSVLMEQVFVNLIGNSLKFAPPQSTIQINAKTDEKDMQISINNQGPWISDEDIEHLFEKFYPISGNEASRGTGLGLSICKGIVEAHGGKIWAENLPTGVSFIFSIPLSWNGNLPVLPEEESDSL